MRLTKKIICSVAAVISLVTGGTVYGPEITQSVGQVVIANQVQGELRISSEGLEITGNAEGCRQSPYTCPAGLATNGIGNAHDVPNAAISLEQVAIDWVANIQQAEACISQAEKQSGKTMTQGQFDAFTSFSFNTGCTRFMRNHDGSSTGIYRYITQGNFPKACDELLRWVYGGGKKLKGLVIRRGLEHDRCTFVEAPQLD